MVVLLGFDVNWAFFERFSYFQLRVERYSHYKNIIAEYLTFSADSDKVSALAGFLEGEEEPVAAEDAALTLSEPPKTLRYPIDDHIFVISLPFNP